MPASSMRSRSRSLTRLGAPSQEAQEKVLCEFARLYWVPPDSDDTPPWVGQRGEAIMRFRDRLVGLAEAATILDSDSEAEEVRFSTALVTKDTVVRWQRFTFYEDVARMSDVLFRGPIEPRHADDVDIRLHNTWRRLQCTILDFGEFHHSVSDFRVSAVRVAMMLETARPPEANELDGHFNLPDARTLASLLSLRCEKDDVEELLEMYRLVCQKLEGETCTWCGGNFDECSSAGLFDGAESLVVPVTVPKVFVPQCGHAVHTLCFGSQLIPDQSRGVRGLCRRCGLPYGWTSIDIDPMINAFCLLFGNYVDQRAQEMSLAGEVIRSAVVSIAEVCQAFSQELHGRISASSSWVLLTKRHGFADPETVRSIGELVLQLLLPPQIGDRPFCQNNQPTVIGPEDVSDAETQDEAEKHVTEVFLPPNMAEPEPLEPLFPSFPGAGAPGFVEGGEDHHDVGEDVADAVELPPPLPQDELAF